MPELISGYWPFYLLVVTLGFAVPEAAAILTRQKGDTLSENIRLWLKTDTPGGGKAWLRVWGLLMIVLLWLCGHILEVWP